MKTPKFITVTIWMVLSCTSEKLVIVNNAKYAIGKIDVYRPAAKLASQIQFEYSVKHSTYHSQYENGFNKWAVPASCGNCSPGSNFMVQYDSLNTSLGRMLFDYPVADSAAYRNYIALFKKTPPGYPSP